MLRGVELWEGPLLRGVELWEGPLLAGVDLCRNCCSKSTWVSSESCVCTSGHLGRVVFTLIGVFFFPLLLDFVVVVVVVVVAAVVVVVSSLDGGGDRVVMRASEGDFRLNVLRESNGESFWRESEGESFFLLEVCLEDDIVAKRSLTRGCVGSTERQCGWWVVRDTQ